MNKIEATRELTVKGADVTVKFVSAGVPLHISEPYPRFLVADGKPDILMQVHYGPLPHLALGEKLFDSNTFWTLHRCQGKLVFVFSASLMGLEPYSMAILEPDFSQGDLYFLSTNDRPRQSVSPLAYPFDELLLVNYLAGGRGLDIHACGVDLGGHGVVFCGVSGAGKSTTSRLWH